MILVYSLLTLCYYIVAPEHRVMSESVFRDTWLKLLPYTITAKPMSDLCWTPGWSYCHISSRPSQCRTCAGHARPTTQWSTGAPTSGRRTEATASDNKNSISRSSTRRGYTTMVEEAKKTCRANQLSDFVRSAPCSRQVKFTTVLITRSKFTCRAILFSQVPFTFLHRESVVYLGSAVRGSLQKSSWFWDSIFHNVNNYATKVYINNKLFHFQPWICMQSCGCPSKQVDNGSSDRTEQSGMD